MPAHKGHEYLIQFAKQWAQNVVVVVDCLKEQTIPPDVRARWLREQIPDIKVLHFDKFMPQEPSETENFWDIWTRELLSITKDYQLDCVAASMDYGWTLAEKLNCTPLIIDTQRESIHISATQIRENLFEHWEYLMDSVKADYTKRICFLGPESTGKTFLAQKLAKHFHTIFVPEYAKLIIDQQQGDFLEKNIEEFIYGQIYSENAAARHSNKIMLCDSSAITTKVYEQLVFNKNEDYIHRIIAEHKYDKYFLFYPDTPYIHDTHRNIVQEDSRMQAYHMFEKILQQHALDYTVVQGNYEMREALVINEINRSFFSNTQANKKKFIQ